MTQHFFVFAIATLLLSCSNNATTEQPEAAEANMQATEETAPISIDSLEADVEDLDAKASALDSKVDELLNDI